MLRLFQLQKDSVLIQKGDLQAKACIPSNVAWSFLYRVLSIPFCRYHFLTCVWRYIPQSYDKVGKHVNNCGVYSYVMCSYTVYTLHTAIYRWQVHTRKEVPKMCQPWAVLSQKCKAHYPHINQHINGTFFCFLFSRKHLQLVDGPLVFARYIDYWRVVFLVRCFFSSPWCMHRKILYEPRGNCTVEINLPSHRN